MSRLRGFKDDPIALPDLAAVEHSTQGIINVNVGARLEKVDVMGPPMLKSLPQRVDPDGRLMGVSPVGTSGSASAV